MLITGASGGIGRALVQHFARKEYQLILHTHEQAGLLNDLIESENFLHEPVVLRADLTFEEAVIRLCGDAQRITGRVDILVNNAGVSSAAMSWKLSLEEWQNVLSVNLTAPFLMIKHLLPGMRKNEFGRIINISSVVAQTGVPGTAAYAASKAGLFGLTASVAKEVVNKGITANTVALGYMNEGMINDLRPEMKEEIIQTIPAKQLGKVSHLGGLIDYLTSEEADYITGQTLNLNGGLYGG